MGGVAKGLLVIDGETLVARWARLMGALDIAPVLVGEHPAYASSGLPHIDDAPDAEGPLAGILALLVHAQRGGSNTAVAVACDMPYVSLSLLRRLVEAPPARGGVIAARRDGRWEPFLARYEADAVLPIAQARASRRELSLQGLLDACAAAELDLAASEHAELRDWDTAEDMDGRVG